MDYLDAMTSLVYSSTEGETYTHIHWKNMQYAIIIAERAQVRLETLEPQMRVGRGFNPKQFRNP